MGAVVVEHHDDVLCRRQSQVQELLHEPQEALGVGPVGEHVDQLDVVAAYDAEDGHRSASGGL